MVDEYKNQQERPKSLPSETTHLPIHGTTFIITTLEEGHTHPREMFIKGNGYDPCMRAALEGLARMVNLALEEGVDQGKIEKSLMGIVCCPVFIGGGAQIQSIPDALAQILRAYRKSDGETSP